MHQTKDDEHHTASYRIALHFVTLLEQQFPVINSQRSIELHYPHQFADQLNVHVNHLNRALKKIFGKTTTHLISERILNESKRLLTEGELTASEIAFTLGFSEPYHHIYSLLPTTPRSIGYHLYPDIRKISRCCVIHGRH